MNLNKLFSAKYLFQNLKKSKMTISLFFTLVPIFTSLLIIASSDYVFEFGTLGLINILGMYIIPFIISMCLFGYVFKKNSVDFMGSMPISRKCIFVTNTLGGIALISIMQMITFFLTVLISSLTKGIVFTSMAWDIFVFQTIAYIFVFTATNLAMSVSGTLVTQIAVTMLIVFIVPFSTWYVNLMAEDTIDGTDYTIVNSDIELMKVNKIENYTAPFLIANNGIYEYHVGSMWKMILLSLIYFIIGYIVFHKRKMEVAGESFQNKYVHFIVKGLTLIPFVAVLKGISEYRPLTLAIIIIAIIFVYYIIFDLITSKKIRLWENIIACIVSITTIYGVYSIAISLNENIDRKLKLNSINSISINIDNRFYSKITEKNLIKNAVTALSNTSSNYYNERRHYVDVVLNGNNGTKYTKTVFVGEKTLNEIFDENYMNIAIKENAIISNTQIKLTQKERELVIKELNETLKNITLKELINLENDIDYPDITINEYQNHELITIHYPIMINQEIQKMMMNAYNKYAVEFLNSRYYGLYYTIDSFGKFDEETREKIWFAVDHENEQYFSTFILENSESVPENMTKCIKISTYYFSFYTDKIDTFLEIVDKICEENKEEFEYYKKGYIEDDPSSFPDKISSFEPYNTPVIVNESAASGDGLQEMISGDKI